MPMDNTGPTAEQAGSSPPAAAPDTPAAAVDLAHLRQLGSVHAELTRLEALLCGGHHPVTGVAHTLTHGAKQAHVPAWLRVTRGESRWPVAGMIVVAIALQLVLPDRLTLVSKWMLPGLEAALLVALIAVNPTRLNRESAVMRGGSLTLTALVSVANGWSAALLAVELVGGRAGEDAGPLLSTGAAIWLTNIIAFALWYWQFDRGGPAARAHARRRIPDFLFVQMQTPEVAHPDWEPAFLDYLYLSFTNATAFSPTDVMPLSRWAKLTMLVQSLVSLVTVALVIARAVNILK
ncbi:MAG TPA: hypothetical protein VK735_26790 [Pseudonocardia sp.]|uniref:hypothetical protein n=1 Tax=Pseudonocardia sp. TaxID=60912 RepID=UPI002BD57D8A|nr:hypothetical protein [Pseudonocardia sp.]HTF51067.1 hypothetical protein [Pseudonocardia sp.]